MDKEISDGLEVRILVDYFFVLDSLIFKMWYAVADLHTKISGAPPTGPNSFVLTYMFAEKRPRQRSAPPTGNPRSAPGMKL